MSKYVVNGIAFNNKMAITEKCRSIISKYNGKTVTGEDEQFILELFKFHPENAQKLAKLKRIFVGLDKYGKNNCFVIEYSTNRFDDISWTKCIEYIPFSQNCQIEFFMPFGKYKNESVYDIYENDPKYIKWMASATTDREIKTKLNQLIKYGYIPYNPVAEKMKRKHSL